MSHGGDVVDDVVVVVNGGGFVAAGSAVGVGVGFGDNAGDVVEDDDSIDTEKCRRQKLTARRVVGGGIVLVMVHR